MRPKKKSGSSGSGTRGRITCSRAPRSRTSASSSWSAPFAAISIMCTYCWNAPSR